MMSRDVTLMCAVHNDLREISANESSCDFLLPSPRRRAYFPSYFLNQGFGIAAISNTERDLAV
jgi:hypothetical protein